MSSTPCSCFGAIGLVGVLWIVAGWSLPWWRRRETLIGGLDQLLCLPVLNQVLQAAEAMPRTVPSILRSSTSPFRWRLAMITAAIVTGSGRPR